eukprot:5925794-Alexandrium_andersonii.AAC.1
MEDVAAADGVGDAGPAGASDGGSGSCFTTTGGRATRMALPWKSRTRRPSASLRNTFGAIVVPL